MEKEHKGFIVRANGVVLNKHGKRVGYKIGSGYRYVRVNSKPVLEHRFIWEAFNGEIPPGMEIDHINTIRDDNRLCNLRLVTVTENRRNPKTIKNYKKSNINKPHSYKQRMITSMYMWFHNKIKKYHMNGNIDTE